MLNDDTEKNLILVNFSVSSYQIKSIINKNIMRIKITQ
jgi:hypothetical protein